MGTQDRTCVVETKFSHVALEKQELMRRCDAKGIESGGVSMQAIKKKNLEVSKSSG